MPSRGSPDSPCPEAQNEDMSDLFPPDGRHSLPNGNLEVELTAEGYGSKVLRRDNNGSLRWQLIPPEGATDVWVTVRVEGGALVATSWSCWSVRCDINSGKELGRKFTK